MTAIPETAVPNLVSNTETKNIGIVWELALNTGDKVQAWVANDTATNNLVVESAQFRVR